MPTTPATVAPLSRLISRGENATCASNGKKHEQPARVDVHGKHF
jgi:hypothetical protein